jgi:hypothetical protein
VDHRWIAPHRCLSTARAATNPQQMGHMKQEATYSGRETYTTGKRQGSRVGCSEGTCRVTVTLKRETFEAIKARALKSRPHRTISGELALMADEAVAEQQQDGAAA